MASRGEGPSGSLILDTSIRLPQRPDPLRIEKGKSSRASTYITLTPLPCLVSPSPRYIAAGAASQIITNYYDARVASWMVEFGIQVCHETVRVDKGALRLMNSLLDQLLFNFLTIARSAGLSALRPAILEVLRTKLATDAMVGADDELHDYLGTDDPALLSSHVDPAPEEGVENWDAVETWKRTRLRCMVYSSLGEMEEEDEDRHMEQLRLDRLLVTRNYSRKAHIASPAVAIFLTAILEYIGERALIFASKQAYHRLRLKAEYLNRQGKLSTPLDMTEPVVILESDMDKVALDRTLGRLWRNWRKSVRSPPTSATTVESRNSFLSRDYSPTSSNAQSPTDQDARRPSIESVLDQDHIAAIPLPISADDVREIEIPGLAYYKNKEKTSTNITTGVARSVSMLQYFRKREALRILDETALPPQQKDVKIRKRSNSLPTPVHSADLKMPEDEQSIEPAVLAEPVEDATPQKVLIADGSEDIEGLPSASLQQEAGQPELEQPLENLDTTEVGLETTETRPMSKDSIAEQYFVERPKIMTSHRVSISGGAMSPDGPVSPRPISVHSPTVHSIRLIDVPSRSSSGGVSRSPSNVLSRSPSRPQPGSVPGSVESTTPILRSATASPFLRTGSGLSGSSSQESIAEERSLTAPDNRNVPEPQPRVSDDSVASIRLVAKERAAVEPEVEINEPPRPTFVLAPAPVTQRRAIVTSPEYQTRNNVHDSIAALRTPGIADSGVPPLTPLREMMEIAADTSDEASSIAPSNDSRSVSEKYIKGHTPSISVASIGQPYRGEQQRRPIPPERSIHRTRNDSSQKPSANEILNRSNRSMSQSSSATSHSNKLKPMRTSSEFGEESKGKSFEELIRSDQTIQYTLTPQNMREIEVSSGVKTTTRASAKKVTQSPDSPRVANPPNFGNEGSTGSTPPRPNTGKSFVSVNRYTGLYSNPPAESPMTKSFSHVSKPISTHTARSRTGGPQARDARIDRESIGDFADFIRSTGPTGLSQLPPQLAPSPNTRSIRGGLSRNASASHSRTGRATPIRRSESSSGRARLLAREAVVPHSDNNSDLIDFIRQGPPSENTKENPRIPRTVAPFRTTMDSDQMTGAISRSFEPVLPEARRSNTSTNVPESMHSSVNSQSALLNGPSRKAVVPVRSHNSFDQEDQMPVRKTRRVLDPYAIDLSDEDEEDMFNMSHKKPQRQEESLMDFLNSVPPPPSTPITPEVIPKAKATLKKKPSRGLMSRFTRASSSSNIPASDIPPLPTHSINHSLPRPSNGSRPATHAPQVAPQHSFSARPPAAFSGRTGTGDSTASTIKASSRPYMNVNDDAYTTNNNRQYQVPPSTHHQIDKPISYQPARGNYISHLDTERKPPTTAGTNAYRPGTGVTQRSYQPREARQKSEGTTDLAAFLMASAPPPTMESRPEPFLLSSNASSNSGGGFSKMFRKKKALGGYA